MEDIREESSRDRRKLPLQPYEMSLYTRFNRPPGLFQALFEKCSCAALSRPLSRFVSLRRSCVGLSPAAAPVPSFRSSRSISVPARIPCQPIPGENSNGIVPSNDIPAPILHFSSNTDHLDYREIHLGEIRRSSTGKQFDLPAHSLFLAALALCLCRRRSWLAEFPATKIFVSGLGEERFNCDKTETVFRTREADAGEKGRGARGVCFRPFVRDGTIGNTKEKQAG